jgi:hypothetical protein
MQVRLSSPMRCAARLPSRMPITAWTTRSSGSAARSNDCSRFPSPGISHRPTAMRHTSEWVVDGGIYIVRSIAVMLSEHRDLAAAKAFFRSAKAVTGVTPDRVTTDGHDAYPRAIRTELGKHVRHRTSRHLNNRLEQDHRGIKGRCRPVLGLKSTGSAKRYCRSHDELRNFLRGRCRMRQHVPAAAKRWQHMRRMALALGILETA